MSNKEGKHVIVVGAGPGGLTCAMILAHRGFKVTVFEEKPQVGGRNASINLGPYVFDTGPTFLMLKDVLDEVFKESGADSGSVLDFRKLEPMYRLRFADKQLDVTGDHERMKAEIGRVFPGKEATYDRFYAREQERFAKLFPCLQKSYHRLSVMFSRDMRRALPHMALTKTLYDIVFGYFGIKDLALSFTFQAKYLGMSPWECPGLFAMIAYIEHAYGVYHPIGGLSRISEAMADVARRNGASIRLGTKVKRIMVENHIARGVELEDGEKISADDVVINADFGNAMTNLFDHGVISKYSPRKLRKKKFSCSTFMLYLGLDTCYEMPHHCIYFARDYRANVERIFAGKPLGKDFSFYVRNASVTDSTLAPAGHSAIYVLVPAPNNTSGIDWRAGRADFRELVLDAMESRAGMAGIKSHIREEKVIVPNDWETDYHVYAGATFNLAHNISQMLYFRPRNKFEEVDRCYLVGGGTHPGSGLPTIYESGRITANLLSRFHKMSFVSGNLEV
jgi:phytoene desaturase